MTISRRSEIANPQQDHSRLASSRVRTTLAVLLLALTLLAPERGARAQTGGPPLFLPYQARLLDSTGTPVSGMMNVAFAFYDVPIGGAAILTDMHHAAMLVACRPVAGQHVPELPQPRVWVAADWYEADLRRQLQPAVERTLRRVGDRLTVVSVLEQASKDPTNVSEAQHTAASTPFAATCVTNG